MEDHDLLSKELEFISREARGYVLAAVHCALFNKAGTLEGNTAGHDVDWFACELWHEVSHRPGRLEWDAMTEGERAWWYDLARVCLERLPYLLERIAHRCRVQAEAVRSLMKADKLHPIQGNIWGRRDGTHSPGKRTCDYRMTGLGARPPQSGERDGGERES